MANENLNQTPQVDYTTQSGTPSLQVVRPAITRRVEFDEIPIANAHLFAVVEGVPAYLAAEEADFLESHVQRFLQQAVGTDGMDGDDAHVCQFLMDAARALREAI